MRTLGRPTTRALTLVLTAFLTLALLLAGAATAHAERWSGTDPARDHLKPGAEDFRGRGDIVGVRAVHAPRRVYVDTRFRTGPYDEMTVYLDTRVGRRGPELALYKTYYGVSLWRIKRDGFFGRRVRCDDMGVRSRGRKVWAAHVARRCLADASGRRPAQVRVKVESADETYYGTVDYAPGGKRYSPWLAAG